MPSDPTNPQQPAPALSFKIPHLTPVLDGPSTLVPNSEAFSKLQDLMIEKTNLEFMPVKFRTPEHRARLVVVRQQCEELEKQVVLERMEAQIAQLRLEIQALQAQPRQHGRKPGPIGARTRKQRLAAREAIAGKQAGLSKLEEAKAKLSGSDSVAELHPLTRNQFLKMAGLSVLALTVWNEAAAVGGGGIDTMALGSSGSSWFISWAASSGLSADGASAGSASVEASETSAQAKEWRSTTVFSTRTTAGIIALAQKSAGSSLPVFAKLLDPSINFTDRGDDGDTFNPEDSADYPDCICSAFSILKLDLRKCHADYSHMFYQIQNNLINLVADETQCEILAKAKEVLAETLLAFLGNELVCAKIAKNAWTISKMGELIDVATATFNTLAETTDTEITSGLLETIDTCLGVALDTTAAGLGASVMGSLVGGLAAGVVAQLFFGSDAYGSQEALFDVATDVADEALDTYGASTDECEMPVVSTLARLRDFHSQLQNNTYENEIAEAAYGEQDKYGLRNALMQNEKANVFHLIEAMQKYLNSVHACDSAFLS